MTYTIDIYNKKGDVVENMSLNEHKFADHLINESLIHEYHLLQMSNQRVAIAHTKTRGEVLGSNKKLYRQKGTGNARVGDRKSPIRVGGGIAFGPRSNRNFTKTMNKKARKKALFGLLTLKAQDKLLVGLDGFNEKEPKTKKAVEVIKNIGLDGKKLVVVLKEKNNVIEKSFRNIPGVKYLLVNYLNPYDILHADKIVFMKDALETLND